MSFTVGFLLTALESVPDDLPVVFDTFGGGVGSMLDRVVSAESVKAQVIGGFYEPDPKFDDLIVEIVLLRTEWKKKGHRTVTTGRLRAMLLRQPREMPVAAAYPGDSTAYESLTSARMVSAEPWGTDFIAVHPDFVEHEQVSVFLITG